VTRDVNGEKIPVMHGGFLLLESMRCLDAYYDSGNPLTDLELKTADIDSLPTIYDKFDPFRTVWTVNLSTVAFLCAVGGIVKWCHNKLFGSRDKRDINKPEGKNIQISVKQKQQQAQPEKPGSQQSQKQEKQGELQAPQSGVRERSDQQAQSAPVNIDRHEHVKVK